MSLLRTEEYTKLKYFYKEWVKYYDPEYKKTLDITGLSIKQIKIFLAAKFKDISANKSLIQQENEETYLKLYSLLTIEFGIPTNEIFARKAHEYNRLRYVFMKFEKNNPQLLKETCRITGIKKRDLNKFINTRFFDNEDNSFTPSLEHSIVYDNLLPFIMSACHIRYDDILDNRRSITDIYYSIKEDYYIDTLNRYTQNAYTSILNMKEETEAYKDKIEDLRKCLKNVADIFYELSKDL